MYEKVLGYEKTFLIGIERKKEKFRKKLDLL
jgi:hypothetical protein